MVACVEPAWDRIDDHTHRNRYDKKKIKSTKKNNTQVKNRLDRLNDSLSKNSRRAFSMCT